MEAEEGGELCLGVSFEGEKWGECGTCCSGIVNRKSFRIIQSDMICVDGGEFFRRQGEEVQIVVANG